MPIRWMAPESMADGMYSTKTDVWSFGVVVWEIYSRGATPYPSLGNLHVISAVIAGHRLGKPEGGPALVGEMMLQCWETDASRRPDFTTMHARLSSLARQQAVNSVSVNQLAVTVPVTAAAHDAGRPSYSVI